MGARPVAAFLSLGLPRELDGGLRPQTRLGSALPRWPARPGRGPQDPARRRRPLRVAHPHGRHRPHRRGSPRKSPAPLHRPSRPLCSTSPARWAEPPPALPVSKSWPQPGPSARSRHAFPRNWKRCWHRISIPSPASHRASGCCATAWPQPPSTSATASPPTSPTFARNPAWPPKSTPLLLPIHPGATLAQALHGGEDYELLFTAPAHRPHAPQNRRRSHHPNRPHPQLAAPASPTVTLLTRKGLEPLKPKAGSISPDTVYHQ